MPPDFNAYEGRLQAIVADYYDATEKVSEVRRRIAATQTRVKFIAELRRQHNEVATMAAGGKLTSDGRNQLRSIMNKDVDYANGFMDALPRLSRSQSLARCGAYVATIRSTYNAFLVSDLPDLPIEPQSERLECGRWCKCHLKIVQVGPADWDVTWVVNPRAEHCGDCIRLSQEWRPLKIRNGKILGTKALRPEDLRRIKALLTIALVEPGNTDPTLAVFHEVRNATR